MCATQDCKRVYRYKTVPFCVPSRETGPFWGTGSAGNSEQKIQALYY